MAKKRIDLIHFIEDSDDEVFLARMLLETEEVDADIRHYSTLDAFLAIAPHRDQAVPMLILVDMNMPNLKGDAVIAKIIAGPLPSNSIVGMCSGSEDPADRRMALGAGAQFFVRKPLDLRCLNDICATIPQLTCIETDKGIVIEIEA